MELVWNGSRVELFRDGRVFASAKWRGGGLVERVGGLTETEWAETEERIRRETETTIASAFEAAYDERGVDVTQIERMLALSPRERLESLDAGRRAILELAGDAYRD
ncbi:MAG: hypothetical protein KJ015_24135 [Myxococcales bacterium]|nr:hypothetical protein [Myxococcales bacterium]